MTDAPLAAGEFRLSEYEAASPVWLKIKAQMEARLDRYRKENDDFARDAVVTAALRGRIAELKYVLSLDKPARVSIPVQDDSTGR